ncbi:MAG TPA: peptidase T [Thermoanaerobaculia bacterium]|nr:peptidase T [Thermoanaerobaculia bacterium]
MHAFDDPSVVLSQTRIVERFLDYVRIDTQSEETSETCPSTAKQLDLGRRLVEELKELGLKGVGEAEVTMDENGYVLAELPGTVPGRVGLCAHMDTAPAFSGTGVKPRRVEGYDGGAIEVGSGVVLDPADNPELADCLGDTIITTDGTTLLGADDKSGIAAIMGALEILVQESDIPRPTVRVCFNPDEEIGRGADRFPMKRFDCPVAFTVDGSFTGEINVETFSADKAVITFTGVSVHPGTARGKMVNALTWMGKLLDRLPMGEAPECTDGREGFYHPVVASGDAASCTLQLILRDFDTEILEERGERLRTMCAGLMAEEPDLDVKVEITKQYRNMYDVLSGHPEVAEKLEQAVRAAGIEPRLEPIRGGTDGSRLTELGMPTPNIFAGGVNFHGPSEWISTRVLAQSACTILNLVQLFAEEQ